MVDRTAELLGMPGRPLFCPHRSAAFNQRQKRPYSSHSAHSSYQLVLVAAEGRAGLSVGSPSHPWELIRLRVNLRFSTSCCGSLNRQRRWRVARLAPSD
jgi:hypothetical protein